jgi:translation initiation factor IF-3
MTLWEWGKFYYAANKKKRRNTLADRVMLDVKEVKLYLDTAEKNISTIVLLANFVIMALFTSIMKIP